MSIQRRRFRILYYYSSQQLDTGSPKVLLSLVDMLDRDRFEPLLLVRGEGPLVDALASREVEILRGPVGSISLRRPVAGARAILGQRRLLKRHHIDLVHVNELGWNLDLALAAWSCRVPVVFHVHNPGSVAFQNLHRFIASRVLLVSRAQKATISHFDRIRAKTEVLYNSVDLDQFKSGRSLRAALGIRPTDVVVGTVAQVCYRKGIDVLLDVARVIVPKYENVVFLVVGPKGIHEDEFVTRVVAESQEPPLAGRVRFVGSRTDVPDLLATMDLFFLPTRSEPFGIVVIEAMAAGLPVVATAVGGIPEIIDKPELGALVDPLSTDGFVRALTRFLDDPELRRATADSAQASLVGRFDRLAIRDKLITIYLGLLES